MKKPMEKKQSKITMADKRRISRILEQVDDKEAFLRSLVKLLIVALDKGDIDQFRNHLDSWEASADIDSIPGAKERIWKTYRAFKKSKKTSIGWEKFKKELGIHES
jgi:hypothetical protein